MVATVGATSTAAVAVVLAARPEPVMVWPTLMAPAVVDRKSAPAAAVAAVAVVVVVVPRIN